MHFSFRGFEPHSTDGINEQVMYDRLSSCLRVDSNRNRHNLVLMSPVNDVINNINTGKQSVSR